MTALQRADNAAHWLHQRKLLPRCAMALVCDLWEFRLQEACQPAGTPRLVRRRKPSMWVHCGMSVSGNGLTDVKCGCGEQMQPVWVNAS